MFTVQRWSIKSVGPAKGDPQGSSLGLISQHIHRPPGWGAEEWGEKIYLSCEVVEGISGVKSCRGMILSKLGNKMTTKGNLKEQ